MRRTLCPILVGRDAERRERGELLDAPAGGRGAVAAVTGEAGVGKSRLLREVAGDARGRGMAVLTGRAVESGDPAPYRPLAEALFSHLRRGGPPEGAALMPFRPLLGRLVPEWRHHVDPLVEVTTVALAEAVLRLLRILGEGSGCLLAIEDLHWADRETLEIVAYLADNIATEPVACIVTLRDDEDSSALGVVRDMAARRAVLPVVLRRLDDAAVTAMAAACLDTERVAPALQSMLASTADGLPFLVEEVLATALDSGTLRQEGGEWSLSSTTVSAVPVTFVEAVRRRLRAAPGSRDVLASAALLGGRFPCGVLAAACGMAESSVIDHLRVAVDAQLVAVDGGEAGADFHFRHALTRQAIAATLLPPERTDLAERTLAAVVSSLPGCPCSCRLRRVPRIEHHFEQIGEVLDPAEAVELASHVTAGRERDAVAFEDGRRQDAP